jgi:predicted metalloprotease with PDZ domain
MLAIRRLIVLTVALLGLQTVPAMAQQPKCPLDLTTCLNRFGEMRNRPWLGIEIDVDSTGARKIVGVIPGGPAERAGIKPGDVLRRIDGVEPATWFAGKGGWKDEPNPTAIKAEVVRGDRSVALPIPRTRIPEDYLARIIGVHMIEGHLAYAHPGTEPESH